MSAIQDIVSSLQPLQASDEKLSNRETTILATEGVFEFILGELAAHKTPIAELLRKSLLLRIQEQEITNWLVSSSICIIAWYDGGKKTQ